MFGGADGKSQVLLGSQDVADHSRDLQEGGDGLRRRQQCIVADVRGQVPLVVVSGY